MELPIDVEMRMTQGQTGLWNRQTRLVILNKYSAPDKRLPPYMLNGFNKQGINKIGDLLKYLFVEGKNRRSIPGFTASNQARLINWLAQFNLIDIVTGLEQEE